MPSPKVLESEARIELPVLCEEDGKTVLRFSELFGVQEPYWVVGHRRGRQKREPIKGQLFNLESLYGYLYFKCWEKTFDCSCIRSHQILLQEVYYFNLLVVLFSRSQFMLNSHIKLEVLDM